PMLDRPLGVGQKLAAIDGQDRAAVDRDVARIVHVLEHVFDESRVALCRVSLLDEDVVFRAVPAPTPGFIRPAKAKTDIEVLAAVERCKRFFQEPLAGEPIVMDAEARDAVLLRQRYLTFEGFLVG